MLWRYLDYLQAKQIHPLLPAYNAIFVLELALFQMYTTLFLTFFFFTWHMKTPTTRFKYYYYIFQAYASNLLIWTLWGLISYQWYEEKPLIWATQDVCYNQVSWRHNVMRTKG